VSEVDYFYHHQGTAVIEPLKLIQKAWISYFQSPTVSLTEARPCCHKQNAEFRCLNSNMAHRGENSSEVQVELGQGQAPVRISKLVLELLMLLWPWSKRRCTFECYNAVKVKVKFRTGALQHWSLTGLLYSDPEEVPSFISRGAAHQAARSDLS
jgi:hypothetical protein